MVIAEFLNLLNDIVMHLLLTALGNLFTFLDILYIDCDSETNQITGSLSYCLSVSKPGRLVMKKPPPCLIRWQSLIGLSSHVFCRYSQHCHVHDHFVACLQ